MTKLSQGRIDGVLRFHRLDSETQVSILLTLVKVFAATSKLALNQEQKEARSSAITVAQKIITEAHPRLDIQLIVVSCFCATCADAPWQNLEQFEDYVKQ